jgi:hypothetical protein
VTFTTAAEDGVGYQGGGRAFRGGRGRGMYSWASERPARRLGAAHRNASTVSVPLDVHRTASRHAERAASRLSRVRSTLSLVAAFPEMLRRDRERWGLRVCRAAWRCRCERSGVSGARRRHSLPDVRDMGPDLQAVRVPPTFVPANPSFTRRSAGVRSLRWQPSNR